MSTAINSGSAIHEVAQSHCLGAGLIMNLQCSEWLSCMQLHLVVRLLEMMRLSKPTGTISLGFRQGGP